MFTQNSKTLGAVFPEKSLTRNSKTLGAVFPEKSLTKNFIGEKEKWTNKGNDKHKDAGSVLHNTRSHSQCLCQISKS